MLLFPLEGSLIIIIDYLLLIQIYTDPDPHQIENALMLRSILFARYMAKSYST